MKKTLLLAIFVSAVALSMAAVTSVTLDFVNEVGGLTGGNASFGSYNFATNHFLVVDYNADAINVCNGTTGAIITQLDTTGLVYGGGLGLFTCNADSSGVVYAGIDKQIADPEPASVTNPFTLVRWANESAVPVQSTPTPSGTVIMEFPRAMDILGTGVDTMIGVTGGNDYKVTFLTTTNGTSFAVTDYTPAAAETTPAGMAIKQGVALAQGNQKVFGTKCDGSGYVSKQTKTGGVWAADPLFDNSLCPSNVYSWIGYASGLNAIFVINHSTNDLHVFDGDTFAETLATPLAIGMDVAASGYGTIKLNELAGVGYFCGRSAAANSFLAGKFSYPAYIPPVPTPIPTNVTSPWGLYE